MPEVDRLSLIFLDMNSPHFRGMSLICDQVFLPRLTEKPHELGILIRRQDLIAKHHELASNQDAAAVLRLVVTEVPQVDVAYFCSDVGRDALGGAFLLAHLGAAEQSTSLLTRAKIAYYRQELHVLPGKLGVWGPMIDHRKYPHNSPDTVSHLVTSLHILAQRIEVVIARCRAPQATGLIGELREDFGAWLAVIEQEFTRQAKRPHAASVANLQERLAVRLSRLNLRIEAALNRVGAGALSDEARRNFSQFLGSFRALSQAVLASADAASHIDWAHWREERF